MRKLADCLGAAINRQELARAIRANRILRDWPAIVGPLLCQRSHPDKFENGTVWVAVEGSAWAQELRMQKETILARLRERATDANLFQDVRFGVRPLPRPVTIAPQAVIAVDEPMPELSIKEIAERRLNNWPHADRA